VLMYYVVWTRRADSSQMKKLVTFRFDVDVLARARRLAQGENRTLTNFIETILKQSLNGNEKAGGPLESRQDRV